MITSQQERTTILTSIETEINYVSFFTNYDIPTGQELMSTRNKLAKISATSQIVNNKIFVNYTLSTSQANCFTTTVVSDAGNSLSQLKLNSVTSLLVGDRIKIGNELDSKILTIHAGTKIITLASNLSAIPSPSTAVKLKISQIAIVRGGDSSLSTGEILAIEQYTLFKDSSITKAGTMTGELT